MTPAKLEANRRNAQKSTGPKTENGKAVSKLNALKHGLLAQTVVVRGHKLKESTNEFKKLCQEFYTGLAPGRAVGGNAGRANRVSTWRLRRARTAESGEIALSVDTGWWQLEDHDTSHPALICMAWEVSWSIGLAFQLAESAVGAARLMNRLREVREGGAGRRIDRGGQISNGCFQGQARWPWSKDLEKFRSRLRQIPERLEPEVLRDPAERAGPGTP